VGPILFYLIERPDGGDFVEVDTENETPYIVTNDIEAAHRIAEGLSGPLVISSVEIDDEHFERETVFTTDGG
jgi:hypothetical protein